jgi:hypothetical protein
MKVMSYLKTLSVIFFLVMGFISTTGATFMQTSAALYVDAANGSDNNNGSSISTAFKTIQKAVNSVQPGMTIYVRAGTYNENIVVSTSGTAAAPITLTHYASESATINGGSNMALRTSSAVSYWILDGLTIKALNSRYTLQLGFWGTPETTNWTVRNNTIYGANYIMGSYHLWTNNNISGAGYTGTSGDAGISDGNDSHNNTYRGNTVHDFSGTDARGIWTQGKTHDNLIENNTVYNINTPSGLGQCIDLDGAGGIEWRHTVRGNRVSGCSYVGIQLENVFATTVENNIITGGNAGIIVISYDAGVGCKVGGEANQYGDTNGDGSCQGDLTNDIFRQNLVTTSTNWGWGYGGIMNWYAGGVKIWGNTLSSASAAANGAINFQGTAQQTQGGSIKSNIITQGTGNGICATDLASIAEDSNNLVYLSNNGNPYASGASCNTTYSLAQYQSMTGKGQNSLSGNPQFKSASDFHLNSGSSAIDHGANVGLNTDLDGLTRPNGASYDIGAYEYGGVSPTATPASAPTATPLSTTAPTTVPTSGPANTSGSATPVNLALGKPATQSSTYQGAVASRAVDGNTDGVLADNSLSHTNFDAQAWWQVDLGASANIQSINLWNRTDCCDWRLTNFYVFVSDSPFTSTNLTTTLNQAGVTAYNFSATAARPSTININHSARYIRVQLTTTDNLHLAEVQVMGTPISLPTATAAPTNPSAPTATPLSTTAPTTVPTSGSANTSGNTTPVNLALGKPATQSSTYQGAVASRAVDGKTDGVLADNSLSHTNFDAQAWWQVDLGASANIQYINLWNRTDCCDWRLTNFYVFVSDSPFTSTNLTTTINQAGVNVYHFTGTDARPSAININRSGRYIRVQLTTTDNLHLAEVQVIGTPITLSTAALVPVPTTAPTAAQAPTFVAPAATQAPATVVPAATLVPTTAPADSQPASQQPAAPVNTALPAPTSTPSADGIINLALKKTATQSSIFQGNVASHAVDGNTDGVLADNSVSHTDNYDAQAWWQVDLGASYTIQTINLWNRSDCCDWRLTNFYVFVSDSPFPSTDLNSTINQAGVTAYHFSGTAGKPSTIDINRSGRYIRVQLTSNDNLQLAEVQVMGLPTPITAALSAPIAQPTATTAPTNPPPATQAPTNPPAPTATLVPTTAPTATLAPTIAPTNPPAATPAAPTSVPASGS